MLILGIESSCDETAAAVVQDGRRLLSNVVNSQIDIHAQYGGVVPEVAARSHLEVINPVINTALSEAGVTWDDIDAIAVTYAPGLSGSLLIGTLAAKTLAYLHDKPLYPVHHVEAHVYANFLTESKSRNWELGVGNLHDTTSARVADDVDGTATRKLPTDFEGSDFPSAASQERQLNQMAASGPEKSVGSLSNLPLPSKQPTFPMLALIVSGGHSQLVLFRDHGDYTLLGQTQDDAVGEAFDKVAKMLGLPYPGGPSIARAAETGDAHKYDFPKAQLKCTHRGAHTEMERKAQSSNGLIRTEQYGEGVAQTVTQRSAQEVCHYYDFSFSGLKTAVLRRLQHEVGVDFTFPSHELPGLVSDAQRHDFAASFQRVAIETLVDKAHKAYDEYQPASVVIAGGVAANQELRRQLSATLPLDIDYAPIQLCTDNAAMIATLGYYQAQRTQPTSPFALEIHPSLSMVAENVV